MRFTDREDALTYVFASLDDPDPALVRLLDNGVAPQAANKLAKAQEHRVEDVVHDVQHELKRGRNIDKPAALIVDILRKPEKYVLPPAEPVRTPAAPLPSSVKLARTEAEEHAAQRRLDAEKLALLSAPPLTQWAQAKLTLKLQLHKHLPGPLWSALERAGQSGQLPAAHLVQDLDAARANMNLRAFIQDLKDRLA